MPPSPIASSSAAGLTSAPPPAGPEIRVTAAGTLVRQALLGLLIATVLGLLLLFAGSEDRGFIYIDF